MVLFIISSLQMRFKSLTIILSTICRQFWLGCPFSVVFETDSLTIKVLITFSKSAVNLSKKGLLLTGRFKVACIAGKSFFPWIRWTACLPLPRCHPGPSSVSWMFPRLLGRKVLPVLELLKAIGVRSSVSDLVLIWLVDSIWRKSW